MLDVGCSAPAHPAKQAVRAAALEIANCKFTIGNFQLHPGVCQPRAMDHSRPARPSPSLSSPAPLQMHTVGSN